MFERFHASARRVVGHAREEASAGGRDSIGCEHLLLGLLAEPGAASLALAAAGVQMTEVRAALAARPGVGEHPLDADALALIGIDLDAVRRAADASFGPGALDRAQPARRGPARRMTMTAEAKKSLELALRAATRQRHPAITTGHLLIGIIDQGRNPATDILAGAAVDLAALREDVVQRLAAAA